MSLENPSSLRQWRKICQKKKCPSLLWWQRYLNTKFDLSSHLLKIVSMRVLAPELKVFENFLLILDFEGTEWKYCRQWFNDLRRRVCIACLVGLILGFTELFQDANTAYPDCWFITPNILLWVHTVTQETQFSPRLGNHTVIVLCALPILHLSIYL